MQEVSQFFIRRFIDILTSAKHKFYYFNVNQLKHDSNAQFLSNKCESGERQEKQCEKNAHELIRQLF